MDRYYAVHILKTLYEKIPDMSPSTVDLLETNHESKKYSIKFTGLNKNETSTIIELAKKQGLNCQTNNDTLIIRA